MWERRPRREKFTVEFAPWILFYPRSVRRGRRSNINPFTHPGAPPAHGNSPEAPSAPAPDRHVARLQPAPQSVATLHAFATSHPAMQPVAGMQGSSARGRQQLVVDGFVGGEVDAVLLHLPPQGGLFDPQILGGDDPAAVELAQGLQDGRGLGGAQGTGMVALADRF